MEMNLRRAKKITALAALVTFSLNTLTGYSMSVAPVHEAGGMPGLARTEGLALDLASVHAIPEQSGSIGEIFSVPAAQAVIYHVQDAHTSLEAQRNIKKILEHMTRDSKIHTIFLEGALEEVHGDWMRFFQDEKANAKAAALLARQGLIGGAELFLLEHGRSDKNLRILGVEDRELYLRNLEAYRSVLSRKSESDLFLYGLQGQIVTLGSKIFNKKLGGFFKEWVSQVEAIQDPFRHFKTLEKSAQETLGIRWSDPRSQIAWPQFYRLVKLTELEKSVDLAKVKQEQSRLAKWLAEKNASEVLCKQVSQVTQMFNSGTGVSESPRKDTEAMEQALRPLGFSFKDYPALSNALGRVILRNEIDAQILMRESEALRDQILGRLAQSPKEKELVRIYQDYLLLKSLLSLELSSEQYAKVLSRSAEINPEKLETRIAALGSVSSAKLNAMKELFTQALQFYQDAQKRDQVMSENMLKQMKALGENKAVLISGGFHAAGLHGLWKKTGVSFVELTPHMSEIKKDSGYEHTLLMNGDMKARLTTVNKPSYGQGPRVLNRLPGYGRYAGRMGLHVRDSVASQMPWMPGVTRTQIKNSPRSRMLAAIRSEMPPALRKPWTIRASSSPTRSEMRRPEDTEALFASGFNMDLDGLFDSPKNFAALRESAASARRNSRRLPTDSGVSAYVQLLEDRVTLSEEDLLGGVVSNDALDAAFVSYPAGDPRNGASNNQNWHYGEHGTREGPGAGTVTSSSSTATPPQTGPSSTDAARVAALAVDFSQSPMQLTADQKDTLRLAIEGSHGFGHGSVIASTFTQVEREANDVVYDGIQVTYTLQTSSVAALQHMKATVVFSSGPSMRDGPAPIVTIADYESVQEPEMPAVPAGWTRAASNPNYAFQTDYRHLSPAASESTLKLLNLATQTQRVLTTVQSPYAGLGGYDVSPDTVPGGAVVVFRTRDIHGHAHATTIQRVDGSQSLTFNQAAGIDVPALPPAAISFEGDTIQLQSQGPLGRSVFQQNTAVSIQAGGFQTTATSFRVITPGADLVQDAAAQVAIQPTVHLEQPGYFMIYIFKAQSDGILLYQTKQLITSDSNGEYRLVGAHQVPSGRTLAFAGVDANYGKTSVIVDVNTGETLRLTGAITAFQPSADGTRGVFTVIASIGTSYEDVTSGRTVERTLRVDLNALAIIPETPVGSTGFTLEQLAALPLNEVIRDGRGHTAIKRAAASNPAFTVVSIINPMASVTYVIFDADSHVVYKASEPTNPVLFLTSPNTNRHTFIANMTAPDVTADGRFVVFGITEYLTNNNYTHGFAESRIQAVDRQSGEYFQIVVRREETGMPSPLPRVTGMQLVPGSRVQAAFEGGSARTYDLALRQDMTPIGQTQRLAEGYVVTLTTERAFHIVYPDGRERTNPIAEIIHVNNFSLTSEGIRVSSTKLGRPFDYFIYFNRDYNVQQPQPQQEQPQQLQSAAAELLPDLDTVYLEPGAVAKTANSLNRFMALLARNGITNISRAEVESLIPSDRSASKFIVAKLGGRVMVAVTSGWSASSQTSRILYKPTQDSDGFRFQAAQLLPATTGFTKEGQLVTVQITNLNHITRNVYGDDGQLKAHAVSVAVTKVFKKVTIQSGSVAQSANSLDNFMTLLARQGITNISRAEVESLIPAGNAVGDFIVAKSGNRVMVAVSSGWTANSQVSRILYKSVPGFAGTRIETAQLILTRTGFTKEGRLVLSQVNGTNHVYLDRGWAATDTAQILAYATRVVVRSTPPARSEMRLDAAATTLNTARIAGSSVSEDLRVDMNLFTSLVSALAEEVIRREPVMSLDDYRADMNASIAFVAKLIADKRITNNSRGVAILTTSGDVGRRTNLVLSAMPYLAALAQKDQKGRYQNGMIFSGDNADAIKAVVLGRESKLDADERAIVSQVVRFARSTDSLGRLIQEETRARPEAGIASSLTDSEMQNLPAVASILRAVEDARDLLSIKDPVKRAEAYVVRAMLLVELAEILKMNAEALRKNPAEAVQLVRAFFMSRLPDVVVNVNADGSFKLGISSVAAQLNVWRLANEAQSRSA